jgi:hypothetical protein
MGSDPDGPGRFDPRVKCVRPLPEFLFGFELFILSLFWFVGGPETHELYSSASNFEVRALPVATARSSRSSSSAAVNTSSAISLIAAHALLAAALRPTVGFHVPTLVAVEALDISTLLLPLAGGPRPLA